MLDVSRATLTLQQSSEPCCLLQMEVASRSARTGTEEAYTFYDQQSAVTAHVVRMLRV